MNKNKAIYLDYAASTPVEPSIANLMQDYLTIDGVFANPSSIHIFGQHSAHAIEIARQQVADTINARANEIVWTASATEANNLAIKGIAEFHRQRGKHIITSKTEHSSVLRVYEYLQQTGYDVTFLTVRHSGLIDLQDLKQAMREDTILVSIMMVNNETGVIQDIENMADIIHEKGAYFHVDMVQAVGKLAVDVQQCKVDLASFSGHKVYAPKGVGALYIRRQPRVRLTAQTQGGSHENGLRAGTLALHQIVAMGAAFELAKQQLEADKAHYQALNNRLWQGLQALGGVAINGAQASRIANILNISFAGVDGNALVTLLPNVALSSGSACSSGSLQPSPVLQAMQVPTALAQASLRLSFGRMTTENEIDQAVISITKAVNQLRIMSPLS